MVNGLLSIVIVVQDSSRWGHRQVVKVCLCPAYSVPTPPKYVHAHHAAEVNDSLGGFILVFFDQWSILGRLLGDTKSMPFPDVLQILHFERLGKNIIGTTQLEMRHILG